MYPMKIFMDRIYDVDLGWIGGVGGGAFAGKAAEDTLPETAEDLSDVVFELSVRETPLLDMLGDSGIQARAQEHEWLEDALNPQIVTFGANITSDAGAGFGLQVTQSGHIKAGMVLENALDGKVTHEQMLVTSINGATTLTVDRAVGGTTATSHASNDVNDIIASAAIEGADPSRDVSTDRARLTNFTQIIERLVQVSGTKQAVNNVGIGNEVDHQVTQRVAEMMREYELSVIRGRKLVSTIQSAGRRTMAGFVPSITQTQSLGSITSSLLDDLLETTWTQGAQPDLILVNAALKRVINEFPGAAVRQNQEDRAFVRQINVYEGFKDQQAIMQNRYMDARKMAVGQSNMIRTVPLRGFQAETLGKVGDARKVQILFEGTIEFGNDKSWAVGQPANP